MKPQKSRKAAELEAAQLAGDRAQQRVNDLRNRVNVLCTALAVSQIDQHLIHTHCNRRLDVHAQEVFLTQITDALMNITSTSADVERHVHRRETLRSAIFDDIHSFQDMLLRQRFHDSASPVITTSSAASFGSFQKLHREQTTSAAAEDPSLEGRRPTAAGGEKDQWSKQQQQQQQQPAENALQVCTSQTHIDASLKEVERRLRQSLRLYQVCCIEVVRAIQQWRQCYSLPLPLMHQNQNINKNYLLTVLEDGLVIESMLFDLAIDEDIKSFSALHPLGKTVVFLADELDEAVVPFVNESRRSSGAVLTLPLHAKQQQQQQPQETPLGSLPRQGSAVSRRSDGHGGNSNVLEPSSVSQQQQQPQKSTLRDDDDAALLSLAGVFPHTLQQSDEITTGAANYQLNNRNHHHHHHHGAPLRTPASSRHNFSVTPMSMSTTQQHHQGTGGGATGGSGGLSHKQLQDLLANAERQVRHEYYVQIQVMKKRKTLALTRKCTPLLRPLYKTLGVCNIPDHLSTAEVREAIQALRRATHLYTVEQRTDLSLFGNEGTTSGAAAGGGATRFLFSHQSAPFGLRPTTTTTATTATVTSPTRGTTPPSAAPTTSSFVAPLIPHLLCIPFAKGGQGTSQQLLVAVTYYTLSRYWGRWAIKAVRRIDQRGMAKSLAVMAEHKHISMRFKRWRYVVRHRKRAEQQQQQQQHRTAHQQLHGYHGYSYQQQQQHQDRPAWTAVTNASFGSAGKGTGGGAAASRGATKVATTDELAMSFSLGEVQQQQQRGNTEPPSLLSNDEATEQDVSTESVCTQTFRKKRKNYLGW